MGAGHGHKLHFHGHSPVHRMPAHHKILALLAFVLVVVATPRDWFAAYGVYLLVLVAVVAVSQVPPSTPANLSVAFFASPSDIASGKVLAVKLRARLFEPLCDFVDRGRLVRAALAIDNVFDKRNDNYVGFVSPGRRVRVDVSVAF